MRRLLILVGSIVFVDAMLFGSLIPLVPGYVDDFGLSKLQAGLLVGAYGGGAVLGGIPGGLIASRIGPKRAVVAGLVLLAIASFGFAAAHEPWMLGLARFVQGFSSTMTWAGALSWLTVSTPRARRGELLGTVFGIAVFGAILGPMFGAIGKTTGIGATFSAIGLVALGLALAGALHPPAPAEELEEGALRRALRDRGFIAGLWLSMLPGFFFGVLDVLAPLALDAGGYGAIAIGAVFLIAGLLETGLNPVLGRLSDQYGRLVPIRAALAASIVVAALLAFAHDPLVIAVLAVGAAVSFGGFYTPGIALISDRADNAGLSQGLAMGFMNSAWALGVLLGPTVGGGVADHTGDAVPYLVCSVLCGVTLVALTRSAGNRRSNQAASSSLRR